MFNKLFMKFLERFNKYPFYKWYLYTLPKLRYLKWYRKLKIDEKAILLESQLRYIL